LGLIASYARPGGNLTGILSQVEGLPGKQVDAVPAIYNYRESVTLASTRARF
jgi:hypothetical protein